MAFLTWNDPGTYWLNVANLVLGVAVLAGLLAMLAGTGYELLSRIQKRRHVDAEIDRDMRHLADDHTFPVPGLGVTMADGGEKPRQGQEHTL
jgi:hypothetical protein